MGLRFGLNDMKCTIVSGISMTCTASSDRSGMGMGMTLSFVYLKIIVKRIYDAVISCRIRDILQEVADTFLI